MTGNCAIACQQCENLCLYYSFFTISKLEIGSLGHKTKKCNESIVGGRGRDGEKESDCEEYTNCSVRGFVGTSCAQDESRDGIVRCWARV